MKKVLLAALMLIASTAFAGNYINVTASSCIGDGSGALLASGTMTIQGTDANDKPIPYRAGSSLQETIDPITRTITTGSLATSLQLANPASSSPTNILYRFTVQNGVTKRITAYPLTIITPNDTLVSGSFTEFNFCKMTPNPLTPSVMYSTFPVVCADCVSITNINQSIDGTKEFLQALKLTGGLFAALPIGSGGTGSATQNFVDLTTAQASIGGTKGFTGTVNINTLNVTSGGLDVIGTTSIFHGSLNAAGGFGATNTSINGILDVQGSPAAFHINLVHDAGTVDKWSTDTGLSRDSAGVIDVGNGAAGNKTGEIDLTQVGLANDVFKLQYIPRPILAVQMAAFTGPTVWIHSTMDTPINIIDISYNIIGNVPLGCTTAPIIRVTDGTTNVDFSMPNSTASNNSHSTGGLQRLPASGFSSVLSVKSIAGAGCTQTPTNVNVAVQYALVP